MSNTAKNDVGDVGFGYIGDQERTTTVNVQMAPKSPLKSAMKVPGTPGRGLGNNNPLSPTFREEELLEKREGSTDKEQARDIVSQYQTRKCHLNFANTGFLPPRESRPASASPKLPSVVSTSAAR